VRYRTAAIGAKQTFTARDTSDRSRQITIAPLCIAGRNRPKGSHRYLYTIGIVLIVLIQSLFYFICLT
jgi:hypothetical protein